MSTRDLQRALRRAGYNPGPIDGKIGKRTGAALRAFQRREGLSITGRLDTATKEVLHERL
jgi:peptidoglycan hydrolase-like protein with peptidoglycan-binding domain